MKVKTRPAAVLLALALTLGAWLVPSQAGAASVKSVQTGSVTMTATTQTASITTVDPTKAFVVCSSRTDSALAINRVTCELSASAVTITAGSTPNNNLVVQWYVVEFEGGVSVQRGLASFGSGTSTVNVSLSAVDTAKSFVLVSERINLSDDSKDEQWTTRARLTSSTNLELSRNATGTALSVAWQVIQMQGASVQRGLTTIGSGSASATASISSVNTATSFLVMSRRADASAGGDESVFQVRGELTNSTTLTFTRLNATTTWSVDIAWEVVSMSDGTSVQKGTTSTPTTSTTTLNAAISAINTSRTVPLISVSGGVSGRTDTLGSTSFTAAFSSTTNLQLQRLLDRNANATVAWFVVQFFKCSAVSEVSYVATNAQSGQAIVYWSSPNPVLILRKTTAFSGEVPLNGQPYSTTAPVNPGDPPNTIGAATVVYNGSVAATSFTDTGLTNSTNESTRYYYKVFAKTGTGGASCYAPGTINTTNGVNASPVAGPDPAWAYMLDGGSILKGGTAGTGALYVTSNASRIISLSTAHGTQSWDPVATNAAVQGWLGWFPVSGGSTSAVIGGDQSGQLYSVDTATGATNWQVALTGAEQVQAPVSVQLLSFSNAAFQATFTTDVIFAASRNSSTTNNKVFARKASDGTVLWTFNPDPTPPYAVDYIVGQPWVDYTRNYLYVASRAGTNGTQNSLWVINTLDGSLVASFALGHLETSPTVSSDGATLYVGSKDATNPGKLYAINLNTLALKWTSPMSLGATNTAYINGFVWEDFTTPGRLYFSTADGNVWCVQDPGAGTPPSGAVWKTAVAGPSSPVLIDKLYVGSSDGKLHQFNPTSGLDEKQFTVGDGTATVGDASTEDGTQVFVGTTAGKIYKLPLPLP